MQLPPVRYVPDSRAPCMSPLFASVHSYTALIWQYQTVDTECATRACAQQSQKAREKVGSTPVAVLGRNGVKCPASSGSAGRSAKFPGMPGMWCCNAVLLYWHQMSKHRVGLQAELRQPQSAGAGHWKEAGRGESIVLRLPAPSDSETQVATFRRLELPVARKHNGGRRGKAPGTLSYRRCDGVW